MFKKKRLSIVSYRNKSVLIIFLLLLISNFYFIQRIKATPNSGVPIDDITSIMWSYNTHNLKNIIQIQPDSLQNNYFFSTVGNQNNISNKLMVLLTDGTVYWENYTSSSNITAIEIGDINNDIEPEIVIGTLQNKLNVFKPTGHGSILWSVSIYNITSIAIEVLNETIGKEIIIFTNKKIYAYEGSGALLWDYDLPVNSSVEKNCISFIDLNSDNILDIIFCIQNSVIAIDGRNRSQLWNISVVSNIYSLECADIDYNGIPDIIIGMMGNISRLNGSNGELIWSFTGNNQMDISGPINNILIQNTNFDIGLEILFTSINKSGGNWLVLCKINTSGNLIQWQILKSGNGIITGLKCGDINGDYINEIVSVDTFGQIIAWTIELEIIWNYTYSSGIDNIVIGYINLDSIPDILIAASDGVILAIGIPLGYLNLSLFYAAIGIGAVIFIGSIFIVFYGINKIKSYFNNKK
ncbi:MAG: hypothetical protein ACTSPY_12315 [Candidatus Helarchaeota archaeon]